MDCKNLMIGDLVQYTENGYIRKVSALEPSLNHIGLGYTEYSFPDYCDPIEVQPIPITDEILKANGFEFDYDAPNLTHDYYSIKLEYGDTFWAKVQYDITNNVVNIKTDSIGGVLSQQLRVIRENVHELQHALRLCGLTELADNFVVV